MYRILLPVFSLLLLACAGMGSSGSSNQNAQQPVAVPETQQQPATPTTPATPTNPVVPAGLDRPRPEIQGRWCSEDPEVGCYRFEGKTVIEEAVKTKRGTKVAARGTWNIEGNILLMRFPNGTWTLEIVKRTENILITKDWDQNQNFTFVRRQGN